MEDGDQTQAQQIEELTRLRRRVAELEAADRELKRMEAALRQASQEWEAIFQAIGHPTLILSPQYVVMAANRAAAEATGMAAEDLVGKHCYEVFHGTSHVTTGCPMAQMLYSGHLEAAEIKALRGIFFTSCTPVFDAQGKLDKVIHIATDVTDLKRAEAALKAQYSTLRGIIDSANALIFSVDRQYRYTSFNQGHAAVMKALYGAEIETGHNLLDYMTVQEDREIAQDNLDRALAGESLVEEAYSGEELRSRRYFRVSHSPIKGEEGTITGVAVLAQDITERKLAEEALHRSNRELRAISNCNQVLLRAVDEQTLLNEICRIVCDEAGYRMAWVGYAEDDEARTIRPVAWAGVEGGYLEQARLTWSDTERGRGPAGMAIRSGEITYAQDFMTDPRMAPWRESALQRGYRSNITLPLKDESARTFGILNIYATEPDAFTPDEIKLLAELAGDLAFGINTLRARIERQRAEEALIEAHSRLEQSARFTEALLSAIPTPVFYKDREGRYLGCNRAFTEVMGVTAAEMTGKTVYELWPSDHAQVYHSKDLELMEHPVRQVYEFVVRDKDGVNRPVIYAKDVFRDENDQVAGIVGAFLDITERKKAEMQIQASEQLFRALVENSPDYIARYDREFRRVYVNPAIQKLFGKSAEDVLDKTPADESPVYVPQIYIDQLRQVFETAVECAVEMPFRTAQGETHWGHMRFVPEFGPDGQVASAMAIGRDIHEIKQAEQARLAHLRFFECMDQINRAIQGTTDLEQMMSDVLDVVLTIFDCDRAGLVYPCDPEAATWHVPMERTRPEYPGAHLLAGEIPMDADVARKQRTMLATDGPVTFGPGSAYPLPAEAAERFNFQSLIGMALQPKAGKPWEFMLQQCSYPRVWTPEEERLFQEIGRRLEDSLGTLLAYRQLQDSEERYRLIAENTADTITVFDFNLKLVYVSPSVFRLRGYTVEETMAQSLDQILTPASLQTVNELAVEQVVLGADEAAGLARTLLLELEVYCKNGTTIWVELTASILRDAHSNPTGILAVVRDITARKQAEMTLSQERELLRTLVDNLPEEVYVKDRERRFLLVNEWVMRSVGVQSADEIIGKRDEDFLPPYLAKQFADEEETIMRTGIPLLNDEHTPPHKPSPQRWYLRTKLPLRDVAGNIIGLVGLGRDITERKRAEEALRQNREAALQFSAQLAALQQVTIQLSKAESSDDLCQRAVELARARLGFERVGIWFIDEDRGFLRGSFGVDEQGKLRDERNLRAEFKREGLGWEVYSQKQPVAYSEHTPLVHQGQELGEGTLAAGALWDGDQVIGLMYTDNLISHQPITEQQLEILRLYATTLGHLLKRKWVETERERLAAQVSEQARELRQILATVPEGVLLLDGERRIVQADPMAEKDLATLAGVKAGDVLTHLGNRSLAELLTSPSTRGVWHEVRADQRIFEVIARPMDNALEPEHWVLVINDVTQAREVREQLQQQERMAAVGQLAAGIAHDFNNIMAVIVLYAQMTAQVENLPALVQERMAIINQQARHATQLIQQILDFSRRSVLERQPLDLLPLLKEQCKLLERTLPENIEISLDYEPAEYIINADLTRIQQVLMNLAVNARDAMPKGGELRFTLSRPLITDKIRCVTSDEIPGGEWVRLAVADTGSGIPAEVLPRIFEPFFTTKAPGQGTGLGLSQVYGIVGAHEGHIDVSTKVGKGTTFIIYLPPLLTRQPEMSALEAQTAVAGRGETLLVVEDDATLRKVLADTLRALNYQVLEAANGQEALDTLQQSAGEIALVISDLVMPGMGGQALFHAMRHRALTLPVIMLSGHPMEQELQRLQAEGLAGWLLKPPDIAQLSHLLARVLQEKAD